jgi:hypothetical protein
LTPPHQADAPNPAHVLSDPLPARKGFSNDARVWNNSYQKSAFDQQSQYFGKSFEKSAPAPQPQVYNYHSHSVPFQGHPDAKVTDKSSTFYYMKGLRNQRPDFYSNRSLYVNGADVDTFTSHALKNMMSEVGEVEYISYLYATSMGTGPAFVR